MSGIARAASTIPGRVATFWSCSSELSVLIASSSSSSAKTRAGTRMSARACFGISQSVSSMRRRSDIEDDARAPPPVLLAELEAMVGDGFHERRRLAAPAGDDGPGAVASEVDLGEMLGREAFRVREEDQLLEPVREQGGTVVAARLHVPRLELTASVIAEELGEGRDRIREDAPFCVRVDLELELRSVLHPAIRQRTTSPPQFITSAPSTPSAST